MHYLRFTNEEVVWQEVPNETTLAYLFSGCPLRCKGCHSAEAWSTKIGTAMTTTYFQKRIKQYSGLITCVLFLGGEWQPNNLLNLLKISNNHGLKTCLYTGLEQHEIPQELLEHLTYLKTGRWIAERGGLENINTNQRFIDLRTGKILNHLFIKEGTHHDTASA